MPKVIRCPRCNSYMYRIYEHMTIPKTNRTNPKTNKQHYVPVGWRCGNPRCRYITQD